MAVMEPSSSSLPATGVVIEVSRTGADNDGVSLGMSSPDAAFIAAPNAARLRCSGKLSPAPNGSRPLEDG